MSDLLFPYIVLGVVFLLGKLLDLLFSYELVEDEESFEFDNILTSLEGSGELVQIETEVETYSGTVASNGKSNIVLYTEVSPDTGKIARWEIDKRQIVGVGYYVPKRDDKGNLEVSS